MRNGFRFWKFCKNVIVALFVVLGLFVLMSVIFDLVGCDWNAFGSVSQAVIAFGTFAIALQQRLATKQRASSDLNQQKQKHWEEINEPLQRAPVNSIPFEDRQQIQKHWDELNLVLQKAFVYKQSEVFADRQGTKGAEIAGDILNLKKRAEMLGLVQIAEKIDQLYQTWNSHIVDSLDREEKDLAKGGELALQEFNEWNNLYRELKVLYTALLKIS